MAKTNRLMRAPRYTLYIMKYFIAGIMFIAAAAPWLPSEAGDNSGAEKKTAQNSAADKKRAIEANHRSRIAKIHPEGTAFCRRGDWYCIHAAASAWWPGAPGE